VADLDRREAYGFSACETFPIHHTHDFNDNYWKLA